MAQLGNLIVRGVSRFLSNINVNGNVKAKKGIFEEIPNPVMTGAVSKGRDPDFSIGVDSVVFGRGSVVATGAGSVAFSEASESGGIDSFACGFGTVAAGNYSYAEGTNGYARGTSSHAEGDSCIASGNASHAEGYDTKAAANYSHTEGENTQANGVYSHAEGDSCIASGNASHAEGYWTRANGDYSHAEGYESIARTDFSHASGYGTEAFNDYMFAIGKYNNSSNGDGNTIFSIGNGDYDNLRSNAFSVTFDGEVKAQSTFQGTTAADYAEYFEWYDGNTKEEDRTGKFVTLYRDKIILATSADDYILGIVSANPVILGNGDNDAWNGMYLRDEFGRYITEPAAKMKMNEKTHIMEPELDENGNVIYEGTKRKINPQYDSTQKYVSRKIRPEWSPIGMLGVLVVYDDGTCEINKYCKCNNEGIATAADKYKENTYRVIERVNDHLIKVVFR